MTPSAITHARAARSEIETAVAALRTLGDGANPRDVRALLRAAYALDEVIWHAQRETTE